MATSTFPPIIVGSFPKGVFLEGVVQGTPLPGSIMEIYTGQAAQEGRFWWQGANLATVGAPFGPMACLLEDDNQGFTTGTAYVQGTRIRMYVPVEGEEMNLLYGEGAGTTNSLSPGQLLVVDNGNHPVLVNYVSTGNPSFMAYDTLSSVAAETLAWVVRIYH